MNYNTDHAGMREELAQLMLDAIPLCCLCWREDYERLACNDESMRLFELSSKQEYLDRFFDLSPEYQPDGKQSRAASIEYLKQTFETGYMRFEWMHCKLDGELIPAEITLKRVTYQDGYIVIGYTRDLREFKANMERMREADERTQIMLDATPMCSNFWDRNFNNVDCNQETVKLFELSSKQEYLDRFFELSPEYQPCGRLSAEMAFENISKAFDEGYCRFEWMHQKLDGEPVPSEITLVRVKYKDDYIVAGYTRDLRELKATMAKMREADERTKIMLDATPLCCNLWDKNFNNIECNQEAVKLFELSSEEEYLERFFELSPEYQPGGRLSAEMALENITKAFNEGYCRFEWMHKKLNGEPVPSEITLVRVKHRGEDIVAGYTRDLRELKAMLNEMHKAEDDLRLARDIAEESTKAKSEFLANMSHEIRTPMNGILGLLHLILNTELTAKQKDYLEKTEQSAKNLLRIINDILDFSKIEAGKLEMESVPFDIRKIFKEMTNILAPKIKERNIDFRLNIPSELPKTVIGDSLRLNQVLMNLINNAIKFTEKGEVSISIEKEYQTSTHVKLKFSVRDTGIGMNAEQVAALFTPFSQADTSITRKYGGTGLGLAISKNLVNIMNGDIWVESEIGHGSTFYFTARFELPRVADEYSDNRVNQPEQLEENTVLSGADFEANNLVLLVEDNEINQLIAEELLKHAGYDVDMANNGQEAIDMLEQKRYGAVLMDIQMPILDGLTATCRIRETGRYNDLPIIAMSAHAMAGDREKSLANGMNDHITKPIDPAVLYDTLNKWLKK